MEPEQNILQEVKLKHEQFIVAFILGICKVITITFTLGIATIFVSIESRKE